MPPGLGGVFVLGASSPQRTQRRGREIPGFARHDKKGRPGRTASKGCPGKPKARIGRVAGLQSKLGAAALVFYQEAEILDGQKAGGAGDFAGLGVDNTELEPDSFGANRNG